MNYTPRQAVIIDNAEVTVPVPTVVQQALERWAHKHADELEGVLAPYGMHPSNIAIPQYRRVVLADEASPNIISTPGLQGGFPCFEGTRIPYDVVLRVVDNETIFPEDVGYYWPGLTAAHYEAAVAYQTGDA